MKKNTPRLARFFCEYCDYEVPIDAKICPRCGHFFSFVRCPACGLTGEHALFVHGCPKCGYAFSPAPEQNSKKKGNKSFSWKLPKTQKKHSNDPLPLWIYVFVLILVILILLLTVYIGS